MRKVWFMPIMLVLLVGCAHYTTQNDKALLLSQQYQSLENTYKSQYTAAGEEEREWLKDEVAPVLDRARLDLVQYNQFVLEGEEQEATDRRLKLIMLMRKAGNKLLEE